jgi:regulator of protease activity HflC (stomatin/prohibitin superfamily)
MIAPNKMVRDLGQGLFEESPAYEAMRQNGLLATQYRRSSVEEIFTGIDIKSNTDHKNNIKLRCMYGGYCFPCIYGCTHTELFVPAGHVGLLMDEQNRYLFAQPGMHNIASCFTRVVEQPKSLRGTIQHGNRTIVVVEQGYIGYAMDNGQPILLPPGIHVWTSESLMFQKSVALNDHVIVLGPYTLLTVDEGYAAVTQNNGKQVVLPGGHCHLLNHKNWKFEKLISLKIQTNDLEKIRATSADNIEMMITSTVNWRIVDVEVAARMAAETMASSGRAGEVSADITKLRQDVLKQAIASLAGFVGGVNYSNTFHMSASNQDKKLTVPMSGGSGGGNIPEAKLLDIGDDNDAHDAEFLDNPLYDPTKMVSAIDHANRVTRNYGVEVMSINIISATPVDQLLTRALASGAVASAEALQAETQARGKARAIAIEAEAESGRSKIEALGIAESDVIKAKGSAEAERLKADGSKQAAELLGTSEVAVELAKMDRSAAMLNGGEKYFFGQEPSMLSNIYTKKSV